MRKKEICAVFLSIMILVLFVPVCRVHAANGLMAASGMTKQESDDLTADITASEADVEILIEATDAVLHDHFGENYSISRKDNVITINMWTDGIAKASMYATEDDALKDDWDSLRTGVQNMAEMIYSVYKPYGFNVVVNLLNDLNKDNVLLSYMNGVLVYDSVNEVNL